MDLKKLFNEEVEQQKIIDVLKQKSECVMEWGAIEKEYNPKLHPIVTDPELRRRKKRERVAKITYGLQKLATRRMTQMAFSIPVKRIYSATDELKRQQSMAIEQIYKLARINSHNMKRFHAFFAACEICTVWFPVKVEEHNKYGFKSKFDLKCKTYTPMDKRFSKMENALLYPLMDENGRMVAMSFEYEIVSGDKTEKFFQTYTSDTQKKWKEENGEWKIVSIVETLTLGKIPAIYLNRPIPVWEDTSDNVTEIELTLSQERDIIKKNSAPLVKVRGELINAGEKKDDDSPREVYQLKGDGDVSYVTWDQQIEAMKFMVDTLKQNIEEELQLPNLSMENVKTLGAMSGEARKTLLTDAHLKVGEESGDIVEMLEREFNVIKAYVAQMNPAWAGTIHELECEHVVTPFIQNDESATVDKYMKATGGKAILSQKTAIAQTGLVEDPEAELKQIQDEEAVTNALNVFTPAQ